MEHRRTRRFSLNLPLSVVRSGFGPAALAGQTSNISSTGVLFTTDNEPSVRGQIEYVINLNQGDGRPVNLRCLGKIVRLERTADGRHQGTHAYQVAATLERYEIVRAR